MGLSQQGTDWLGSHWWGMTVPAIGPTSHPWAPPRACKNGCRFALQMQLEGGAATGPWLLSRFPQKLPGFISES
jgi:hypothetical protein